MKIKNLSLDQPLIQIDSELVVELVNMSYKKYLNTDYWGLVRKTMHDTVGYKCEICGLDKHIAVHHFNYSNLGKETLNDLACLCEECHMGIHNSDSSMFIDSIYNRQEFNKRLKRANKIKKTFTNKQFLKVLPLTQKSAWEIKQLQALFECSLNKARQMYDEELESELVSKSLGVCGKEDFEFYTLDRFAWYIIRLDFPKVDD